MSEKRSLNRPARIASDTTRSKGDGEIDGQDYNFVSRSQFEEYVGNKRFVEHGEFDRQYYGTSLDAVRTVINSGKICVLNLQERAVVLQRRYSFTRVWEDAFEMFPR